MKRYILLIITLCVCSVYAAEAKPISFGFSAGSGASNYKVDGLSISQKSGVYGSLDLDINLLFLNVSPEITYRFNQFDVTYPTKYSVQNHSAEATLLAGFTLLKIVTIEAGPRYIYDIKSRAIQSDGTKTNIESMHPDWGYTAGVSINILKLRITARYNGQFKQYNSSLGETKNQFYTIGFGYRM